ncbi:MAG: hypothetical protein IJ806_10255 [Ruminococcus sp.]|nr:hypothetical protein [Ruminococcus sp.]
MLSGLLSKEECAKCRLCCCFDSYDLWETPILTKEDVRLVKEKINKDQPFVHKEEELIFRMEKEPDRDLYYCPVLDHSKGCLMGDQKPFDCRIWPLRIMSLNGQRVIVLSTVCPAVQTRPLDKIQKKAQELAGAIFDYADRVPIAVKPYISGYPILVVEG